MYHPINFKWFHSHAADTMWVKYARANHEMTGLWGDDHNRTDVYIVILNGLLYQHYSLFGMNFHIEIQEKVQHIDHMLVIHQELCMIDLVLNHYYMDSILKKIQQICNQMIIY